MNAAILGMYGRRTPPQRRIVAAPVRLASVKLARLNTTISLILVGVVLPGGCSSSKKKEEPWVPKPVVGWRQVAPAEIAPLDNLYRIVVPQPTRGLFPTSIAITRVGLTALEDDYEPLVPMVFKDPRNEFLQWNTSFDDQMAISEVFPIDQFTLGGGLAEPEQVVAAFAALRAGVGIIYAMNELGPNVSEMFGTIYDVPNARPIAYLHASAVSIEPPEDDSAESEEQPDLWETDSRALVRRKFETMLYACIFELIQSDEVEVIDVPEGWKRVMPERPVAWPPPQPIEGY